jgi:magnesium-transporting ATPase (P-type)
MTDNQVEKKIHWHALKTDEVIRELDTDAEQGLSEEEVSRRLEEYGQNK